jgi:Protein of unknown function (DUF2442)
MKEKYPAVKKVIPTIDFKLILTFSNGETRLFNMKPFLNKGIFRELRNIDMFHTVHVSFDTIEWENEADFDPEVLFKLGKKIKAPKNISFHPSTSYAAERVVKYNKK